MTNFKTVQTAISERNKETKKNEFKCFASYGLPVLSDVNDSFPAPDSWESKEVEQDGQKATLETPVYKDEKLAFLQAALSQRVVGMARARINAGNEPAYEWEALLESGNAGEYQRQKAEFRIALAKWLKDNKSEQYTQEQQASILSYCEVKTLKVADATRKERVATIYNEFIETLEDSAQFGSMIKSIESAINYNAELVDF